MPEISRESADKFLNLASAQRLVEARTLENLTQEGDPVQTSIEGIDLVLRTPNRLYGVAFLACLLERRETSDLIFIALKQQGRQYEERLRSVAGGVERVYVPINPILDPNPLIEDTEVKRALIGSFHTSYDSQITESDKRAAALSWRTHVDLNPNLNQAIPELMEHIMDTLRRDHQGFRS